MAIFDQSDQYAAVHSKLATGRPIERGWRPLSLLRHRRHVSFLVLVLCVLGATLIPLYLLVLVCSSFLWRAASSSPQLLLCISSTIPLPSLARSIPFTLLYSQPTPQSGQLPSPCGHSDGPLNFATFQPPEAVPDRMSDVIDTFAGYKYRTTCNISSLDLHTPFGPLCSDRQSMLAAMGSGGRIGHDAPYMPRGCDMRWFSSEEICGILGRFERVLVIGDSMMRHVVGSINVLIRKDLGYGAVTDWNFSPEER